MMCTTVNTGKTTMSDTRRERREILNCKAIQGVLRWLWGLHTEQSRKTEKKLCLLWTLGWSLHHRRKCHWNPFSPGKEQKTTNLIFISLVLLYSRQANSGIVVLPPAFTQFRDAIGSLFQQRRSRWRWGRRCLSYSIHNEKMFMLA